MEKIKFFDCNCQIGRVGYPHLLDVSKVNRLLEEMARAGIEEALVYHSVARYGHPPLGNQLLLDEIKGHDNLHPVWVLLPHHTGEMEPPENLMIKMKNNGIKAARVFPGRTFHGFSLDEWCLGDLLSALESVKMPLFLDIETVSWEEIYNLLIKHPNLPLIISNCSYRHNRYLYPLWDKFDHLYVETSWFMGAGTIEDIVKRFGSKRILFGTNLLRYTGTAAVALITYADISHADKVAIASINLERILNEVWR